MSFGVADSRTLNQPSPQTSQLVKLPSPYMGVDSKNILANGDPKHCIYAYNLIPAEYGLRVRSGYREWCKDLVDVSANGVNTLIPFGGDESEGFNDKLFAATNEGIWDVTIFNAPVLKFTFADQSAGAGFGVYARYVTQADDDILFYADRRNGLLEYDQNSDTWSQASGITGPVVENIISVVSHKQRLWLVEENSTKAWYLPIASPSGNATEFFFGGKFTHGGSLVGLYNWTVDGGDGVDDYLVAISRQGDVIPYRGSDPSSSDDWQSVGVFYIGQVPRGNRIATEHGGNLYLLSSYGLISMQDLVSGVDPVSESQDPITTKVAEIIRFEMRQHIDDEGWGVRMLPALGSMVVQAPKKLDGSFRHYICNLTTRAWGFMRGIESLTFEEFNGVGYFGTADSIVYKMDVTVDNLTIDPPAEGLNGREIEFSVLTNYTDLGAPTQFKRPKYLRPDFVSSQAPNQTSKMVFEYDVREIQGEAGTSFIVGSTWDDGIWDSDIWDSDAAIGFNEVKGSWGIGRNVAIAMKGTTRTELTHISWDVIYDAGGPL